MGTSLVIAQLIIAKLVTMKKIITLIICFSTATTLFAQGTREMEDAKRVILGAPRKSTTPSQNPKDVILGGDNRKVYGDNRNGYPQDYPNGSTRESQIYNINRDYDAKIYSIRNNRYLSNSEKERMIRQLEMDRARALKGVNGQYKNKKNNGKEWDEEDRYKKDKHEKGNNGNHYGWEKGKGNPHKGKH